MPLKIMDDFCIAVRADALLEVEKKAVPFCFSIIGSAEALPILCVRYLYLYLYLYLFIPSWFYRNCMALNASKSTFGEREREREREIQRQTEVTSPLSR